LQLAASGGTFPIETAPKFFQFIYNVIPMKYSIALLKESLSINVDFNAVISNGLVFVGIIIVFFAGTVGVNKYKTKKIM